jgi:K(+)-stimulated pyrophosphate-energized sodium pump
MIKVVNMVAVIVAPIVVAYNNEYTKLSAWGWCVVVGLLAILTFVIMKSKKQASE